MARLKLCSHRGCTKVVSLESRFCEYHHAKYIEAQRVSYLEYQHRRLADANLCRIQKFYSGGDWKRLRETIASHFYYIDIFEYYLTGKITEGETAHHIKEIKDDWECRLDILNLIYLTNKNHSRIHSKYNKGKRDKKKAQEILLGLVLQFEKDFC